MQLSAVPNATRAFLKALARIVGLQTQHANVTHIYDFCEGRVDKAAVARIWNSLPNCQCIALIQEGRSIRGPPAEYFSSNYGFENLRLKRAFGVKQAGSRAQYTAFIFCRVRSQHCAPAARPPCVYARPRHRLHPTCSISSIALEQVLLLCAGEGGPCGARRPHPDRGVRGGWQRSQGGNQGGSQGGLHQ